MVGEMIPSLTILQGKGDWWWAGSLQKGYEWLVTQKAAPRDCVLIINDDTEFAADFLEKGLAVLRGHARTLVLARSYDRRTSQLIDAGRHVDWRRLRFEQAMSPEEINCLSTRGLFLRVSDLMETGGFYPRILPHYLSDYEFTVRAHRKGLKLLCDPSLQIRLDIDATGHHQLGNESFGDFSKKYFSKRSAYNPLAWTVFIALACPLPWKLIHWLGLWKSTAGAFITYFMRSKRTNGSKQ
jgi:GT2 family glycosyltransferase